MEVLLLPLFCPLTILPSLHAHSEFAPRANFPIQFSCVDRYLQTARTLAHVFKLYINRITLHVIFCKFFSPHSLLCLEHWIMETLNHRLPCGVKSQAFLITGVGLEQPSAPLHPLLFMCSQLRKGYTCELLEAWHQIPPRCSVPCPGERRPDPGPRNSWAGITNMLLKCYGCCFSVQC